MSRYALFNAYGIPNNTPDMNAHIESFHSILESDCLSRHEFQSYAEAYKCVSEFMDYYNNRRRHGSLKKGGIRINIKFVS